MFGASLSEVYNVIWCQFDLKIDNLILMIGKKRNEWWVLLDVDPACLKSTPPHLCVESKEPEARVPGKSTIIILEKMSEVIADGYLVAALSKEVCSSC